MRIGPIEISLRTKAVPLHPISSSGQGWWPWGVIREPDTGAWQRNEEVRADTALSYFAVYSCIRLITTDIGKLCLRLVEQDADGVWNETESPSFSPVLRRPNHFQTTNKFVENWILSKLMYGNAYVRLERDQRQVVRAMYVLDPTRVTPLVASDGSVYYQVRRDDLSGLPKESDYFPAREIIHDTYIAPFHPLIGLSPIYACGLGVTEGLNIQTNSKNFFANGANPGGMLTAPGAIGNDTVQRLLNTLAGKKAGEVLVGGDGLKFEKFTMSAADSQLIEQLKMTAEQVCSAFGVPPYLVDIGDPPPYANFEPLLLKYHSQCIQSLTTNFEKSLDRGLGLTDKVEGRQLGTEFDIDDLFWMDTDTKTKAAGEGLRSGMTVDEVRRRYHGLSRVKGGDVVYMQEQNHSLAALEANDKILIQTANAPQATPAAAADEDDDELMAASFASLLHQKSLEAGLYAD